MFESRHDQVTVNFIGKDQHLPRYTDSPELLKFSPGPDAAYRIVGIAEYGHFDSGIFDLFLQILEIHFITAVDNFQRILQNGASIGDN